MFSRSSCCQSAWSPTEHARTHAAGSHVQSWCTWVCIYFCSQECPEQDCPEFPAFVDSSMASEGSPGGTSDEEPHANAEDMSDVGLILGWEGP